MAKNLLVLPSGTELYSGTVGNAIMEIQLTGAVNGNNDLIPGIAVASCLEAVIWVEDENAVVKAGDNLLLYKVEQDGTRTQQGVYVAEKPTRKSANTYAITAYDNVSRLDKPLSSWLSSMQSRFPMSQAALASAVASQCGVILDNLSELNYGSSMVQAFYADNLTGRTILAWIAGANCRYVTALPNGRIRFDWYTGDTTVVGKHEYYQGGFTYDDFECPLIDSVRIRQSDSDVGVLYPADIEPENAMVIQGNLILANAQTELLTAVAQYLYEQMRLTTVYRPCKLTMPENANITLGSRISVVNADGNQVAAYVMKRAVKTGKMTLECFGTSARDSSSSVNNVNLRDFQGKMFEMSASIDGLKTKAMDAEGNISRLEQTAAGLETSVENINGEMTMMELSIHGLTTTITDTTGRVVTIEQTMNGLTVTTDTGETLIDGGSIQTDNLFLSRLFSKEGNDSYVEMLDNGLNFILGRLEAIGIGYYSADSPLPYMLFGAGLNPTNNNGGMIKKYPDGVWIGDTVDRESAEIASGTGIFINTKTKNIYKYNKGIGVELADTSNVVAVFG